MPNLITSTNPNAFTLSVLCTTSIGLMGGTYAGLSFGNKTCKTSLLSGREYFSWL